MDRIAIIRDEAQRLADVLSTTAADAPCPTCPDWSAADLLWHLTEVHFFWASVLERNARTESDISGVEQAKPRRPDAMAGLLELRAQATSALLEHLGRPATTSLAGHGGRRIRLSASPDECRPTKRRSIASMPS